MSPTDPGLWGRWEIKKIKAHLHHKVKSFLNLKSFSHFSLKFDPSSS